MFEQWFKDRMKDVVAEADPMIAKEIEQAAKVFAPIGQALIDYAILQFNGVSVNFTTQQVKKADPVNPEDRFRG